MRTAADALRVVVGLCRDLGWPFPGDSYDLFVPKPNWASELSFVSPNLTAPANQKVSTEQPHARDHSLRCLPYLIRHASNRVQQSLRAKSRVRLEHDMAAE